jgi:hypothetical protein
MIGMGRATAGIGGGAAQNVQLDGALPVWSGVAMEHACHVCGEALGRVRASLDPVYKLPIVVCPTCGAACVRRRHPLAVLWRGVLHARATALGLAWRAFAGLLAVGCSLGVSEMFCDSLNSVGPVGLWRLSRDGGLDDRWIESWKYENGPLIACVSVAWCVGLGAALTAGLGHIRRRWVVWSLFGGAMLAWLLLAGFMEFLNRATYMRWSEDSLPPLPSYFWQLDRHWGWICVGLGLAMLGAPLGRALRRTFAKGEARRWIAILRRARKRRMAA